MIDWLSPVEFLLTAMDTVCNIPCVIGCDVLGKLNYLKYLKDLRQRALKQASRGKNSWDFELYKEVRDSKDLRSERILLGNSHVKTNHLCFDGVNRYACYNCKLFMHGISDVCDCFGQWVSIEHGCVGPCACQCKVKDAMMMFDD